VGYLQSGKKNEPNSALNVGSSKRGSERLGRIERKDE